MSSQRRKHDKIVVLRTMIRILKSNNAFPENEKIFDKKLLFKFAFPAILTAPPLFFGILGHMYITLKRDIWPEPLNSLTILTQLFLAFSMLGISLSNWKNSILHFERLGKFEYGEPEACGKFREKADTTTKWAYYTIKSLCILHVTFHYLGNSFCTGSELEGDEGYVCGIAVPLWYPFKMNFFLTKILSNICLLVVLAKYLPVMCLSSVLFSTSVRLVIMRVKELKKKITENKELNRQNLLFYIKYHAEIIDCVEKLNNDIGYNHLPHYFFIPVLMASLLYQLIVKMELIALFALLPWLAPIAFLSLLGERLTNEGSSLFRTVYDIPWYEADPNLRKLFNIFLGRLRNPLRMRVRPLAEMNHLLIHQIVKGSYSLLVYLNHGK